MNGTHGKKSNQDFHRTVASKDLFTESVISTIHHMTWITFFLHIPFWVPFWHTGYSGRDESWKVIASYIPCYRTALSFKRCSTTKSDSDCISIPIGIVLQWHESLKHGDTWDSKSISQVKLEHFIFKWQMLTGGRDTGIMAGGWKSTVIDLTTLACFAHGTISSLATCAKKHLL